jgi:predicted transcriptional regulator
MPTVGPERNKATVKALLDAMNTGDQAVITRAVADLCEPGMVVRTPPRRSERGRGAQVGLQGTTARVPRSSC